jgi:hypothetical protein
MNQMSYISNRLKGYLGAIEGAPAGGGPRREQLVTPLLPLRSRLGQICGATRLVHDLLYF